MDPADRKSEKSTDVGSSTRSAVIPQARRAFHVAILKNLLRIDAKGIPSNADKDSRQSVALSNGIIERLGSKQFGERLAGQQAGSKFEELCKDYLKSVFPRLSHLRPGQWEISKGVGGRASIAQYDQYEHLKALDALFKSNRELATALGTDYLIKPDVVILRTPEDDETINATGALVDNEQALNTPLRKTNSPLPILHASISCKWTLRSDRAQNARSEALNLVRNRKGPLPHVIVVTGEPTPNRIASIALGTGDIDCVYHFALPELVDAAACLNFSDASELIQSMIDGKRLRDISDLPFDLVV